MATAYHRPAASASIGKDGAAPCNKPVRDADHPCVTTPRILYSAQEGKTEATNYDQRRDGSYIGLSRSRLIIVHSGETDLWRFELRATPAEGLIEAGYFGVNPVWRHVQTRVGPTSGACLVTADDPPDAPPNDTAHLHRPLRWLRTPSSAGAAGVRCCAWFGVAAEPVLETCRAEA